MGASSANVELTEARKKIDAMCQEVVEQEDIVELMRPEITKLCNLAEVSNTRLQKVLSTSEAALELAHHWVLSDYEGCRMEIAAALQACSEAAGSKVDDLFEAIGQKGADSVSRNDIAAFFEKNQCAYDKDKLKRVCAVFVTGNCEAANNVGDKQSALEDAKDG